MVAPASNNFRTSLLSRAQANNQNRERPYGSRDGPLPRDGTGHSDGDGRGSREFRGDAGVLRARSLSALPDRARVVRQGGMGLRSRAAPARSQQGFCVGSICIDSSQRRQEIKRQGSSARDHASAAIFAETILSGLLTGSPRLILSTFSMPSVTLPQTVYWPSRKVASSKQMKNWLSPEFGSLARAIDTVPRTCGSLLNSAFSFLPEPPVPVPCGQPVCAINPEMTR